MVATPHLSSQDTSLMYVGGLDQYALLTACDRDGKRFLKCPYIMKEDRALGVGFAPCFPYLLYSPNYAFYLFLTL